MLCDSKFSGRRRRTQPYFAAFEPSPRTPRTADFARRGRDSQADFLRAGPPVMPRRFLNIALETSKRASDNCGEHGKLKRHSSRIDASGHEYW